MRGGGILFDEYFQLFNSEILAKVADSLVCVGGARHALFFAIPMLLIGEWIAENKVYEKIKTSNAVIIFITTWLLALIEAIFLKEFLGNGITLDISIFGWIPAFALVIIGLRVMSNLPPTTSRSLRKVIDVVYVIHVWIIFIIGKLLGVGYVWRFIIATVVSFLCAYIYYLCIEWVRKKRKVE